jgi:hypothetical protein
MTDDRESLVSNEASTADLIEQAQSAALEPLEQTLDPGREDEAIREERDDAGQGA